MEELSLMIEEAEKGLHGKIKDYNSLLSCMSHLSKIRERQAKTDAMFGPLADTVDLLKTYKVEVPEKVYQQLEVSMVRLNNSLFTQMNGG